MRACNCCASAAAKGASRTGQLFLALLTRAVEGQKIGDSIDYILDPQVNEALVVEATGRIATVTTADPMVIGVAAPAAGTLAIGATVLIEALVAQYLAEQEAAQTLAGVMANAVPPIVQAARRYATGDCEQCVRKSVWGQSSPRRYVTEHYQKRSR
jgi:hypothetical protein